MSLFLPKFTVLIAELQPISPLPDDDTLMTFALENHPLDKLHDILVRLEQATQTVYPFELIPALLNVFGIGEGMEVFQHIVTLIETYPKLEEIYPLIQQAASSPNAGTRKWSCLLLGRRRQKEDEPFFVARLHDEVADVRASALVGCIMLSQRYNMEHLLPLVKPLLQDSDWEVHRAATDALSMLKDSAQREANP